LFGFTVLTPHKSESSIFFCVHIFSQTGKVSSTLLSGVGVFNAFGVFGDSFLVSVALTSGVFLATGSFGAVLVDCTKGAFVDGGSVCDVLVVSSINVSIFFANHFALGTLSRTVSNIDLLEVGILPISSIPLLLPCTSSSLFISKESVALSLAGNLLKKSHTFFI
jgi:hypothetical protein